MSPREMNAQSPLVAHDPGRANRPEIDTQADTQSDTLRSGRPCDSWTPLEAKVRESLNKMHHWTLSDAGGSAETDLLIRVPLVRSGVGTAGRLVVLNDAPELLGPQHHVEVPNAEGAQGVDGGIDVFCEVTKNWAARPLDSYETILKYLRTTRTATGLRVRAHLVRKTYRTGVNKVTDAQMRELRITPDSSMPKWNYTIEPM